MTMRRRLPSRAPPPASGWPAPASSAAARTPAGRLYAALLLAALLAFAQYAGFAHVLGHLANLSGLSHQAVPQIQADPRTPAHESDTCTTCLAFAGLGNSAPPPALPPFLPETGRTPAVAVADTSAARRRFFAFRARSPPLSALFAPTVLF